MEHAHLDFKVPESLAALCSAFTGTIALVTSDVSRVRWALESFQDSAKKRSFGGSWVYELGFLRLWVTENAGSLPEVPDVTVVLDAHMYPEDPSGSPKSRKLIVGRFAERGHWFYLLARRSDAVRIGVHAIRECCNVEVDETDRNYARHMLLEDVQPPQLPLTVFARQRLKIRTDKGRAFLSESQVEEAISQIGAVPGEGRAAVVSFELSSLQKHYLAMKRLGRLKGYRRFALLKYRRGGLTTLEQAANYRVIATQAMSYVATFAHVASSTSRIFQIARLMFERDAEALPSDGDSATHIKLRNGSRFFIGTAGGRGVARGDTLQRAHCSEVAFWCEGPNQWREVERTMAGITEATKRGEVVAETTPNGREWFCQTYEKAKEGTNGWFPIFLPWMVDRSNRLDEGSFDEEEILETLVDDEVQLIETSERLYGIKLSPAQIAWRREMRRELGWLAVQEYPENDVECFISTGTRFFDTEQVVRIQEHLKSGVDAEKRHVPGGYEQRWQEPQDGVEYVAGVDTSEGLPGGDRSGIGVLRRDTGEQVASLHGLFRPDVLAEHVVRICKDYNRALVGIERNNHGHAVIQAVIRLGYGDSHLEGGPLFYTETTEVDPGSGKVRQGRAGWQTDAKSRPRLLSDFERGVRLGQIDIHDLLLLDEMLSFRLQDSGKFEADPGRHDDSIIKWAIAWQMTMVRVRQPEWGFATT